MTRSTQKALSRRDAFTKSVRAKAHSEGILFRDALNKTNQTSGVKTVTLPQLERRNPGRNGPEWNGGQFISQPEVDDGVLEVPLEDIYDFNDFAETYSSAVPTSGMTVSILDIARPAKRKGAAKDFEVVQKVRAVVALDDEPEHFDEDMWEAIYDEQTRDARTPYAAVLRGGYDR